MDPWLDEENVLPGQNWDMEIRKAVCTSDTILVCLSSTSVGKSGYVQKEIKVALDVADEKPDGTIFIIPVKLSECEVPERLRRWQWVDYTNEQDYDRVLRALRARAVQLGIEAVPGDGTINRTTKPIHEASGRLLYKSADIQALVRQYKDGELQEHDIEVLPAGVVVGISHEGVSNALDRFRDDKARQEREKRLMLRLVGIRHPYQEWEEFNTMVYCFRNEPVPIEQESLEEESVVQKTEVSSSNIHSIGYDQQRRLLEIQFLSGSVYQYFDVPVGLYQRLMSASSHGRFLDTYIKKAGFAYQQIR